jgi:hypothetical protein
MTSLELVEFINSSRVEVASELLYQNVLSGDVL